MNRLLKRQIRRHIGEDIPEDLMPFLEAIDRSYKHYEDDRVLLERSMDISSEELYESNKRLREEGEKQKDILERLKKSLQTLLSLEMGGGTLTIKDDEDIHSIIELLEVQSNRIKRVEGELLLVINLLDHSTDAFEVCDEEGNFVFVNQRACKRYGLTNKELLQMNRKDFYDEGEGEKEWSFFIANLNATEDNVLLEQDFEDVEGNIIPEEINAKFLNLNGKGYIVTFIRDITERRKSQGVQDQLFQNLKIVNEELENFAYIVSHDLKAPLRGIGSLTDWLIEDYSSSLDDEGKEMLVLMKKRVLRLHGLIEGILQYSRIGRAEIEKVSINLNEMVADIIDMLAPPDHFSIEVGQLPTITNSESSIKQVFQNLISNSLKYNDKEKGQVKINCRTQNNFYQFCVEDNGPGIDEKYHERIFKIFQTLAPKDEFQSTGVGLTIIKKIVEHNQGEVWIESELGEGTKFFFTLPK